MTEGRAILGNDCGLISNPKTLATLKKIFIRVERWHDTYTPSLNPSGRPPSNKKEINAKKKKEMHVQIRLKEKTKHGISIHGTGLQLYISPTRISLEAVM